MFEKMRRIRQQLSEQETIDVLKRGTSGVLALLGEDGYPYAVPLSYVYVDGTLVFHSAKEGHKLDAIRHCERASFCVIDQDKVVPEEYTSYFRSAIAFGKIRILEQEAEIQQALDQLAAKYHPNHPRDCTSVPAMLVLTIEQLTGKEAIELTRQKTQPKAPDEN